MKTIFRALMLGFFMTALTAVSVTTTFAQDQTAEKQALYQKYTDNYKGTTIDQKQVAIDAAEQYIAKYGANAEDKEQVDYFKRRCPHSRKLLPTKKAKSHRALFLTASIQRLKPRMWLALSPPEKKYLPEVLISLT